MSKHLFQRWLFSLGALLGLSLSAVGAPVLENPKKVIIRFQPGLNETEIRSLFENQEVDKLEVLVPSLNLYSITFKKVSIGRTFLKTFATSSKLVKYAQPDHVVKLRQSPNDPELKSQWSLNGLSSRGDIEATKAWELGTGGKDT